MSRSRREGDPRRDPPLAYNLCNGTLGGPVEHVEGYAATWADEPSAAEQTMAIYLNVLALDDTAGL